MSDYTIIVGLTKGDRLSDYSAYIDGYREGAQQTEITLTVTLPDTHVYSVEDVAESVFEATNNPYPVEGLSDTVREAMIQATCDADGRRAYRSLSVGDTVTLAINGSVMGRVAIERVGFRSLDSDAKSGSSRRG